MNQQERSDVLGNGSRVTARGVAPENVMCGTVCGVDMIVSDGCGRDETNRGIVEQRGIAFRAGACEKGVRIAQVVARDCSAGQGMSSVSRASGDSARNGILSSATIRIFFMII